jgi:hypothetical protein
MRTLASTLADYDLELLRVIANRWDADLGSRDPKEAAARLAEAMLQPEKVEQIWGRLGDDLRGPLQTLLGAGGKMPGAVFTRLFGEIRPVGPGKLEREKPYLEPVSAAEALFYRGLIATTFMQGAAGNQATFYVPTDLAALMPTHQTGYSAEAQPSAPSAGEGRSAPSGPTPPNVRQADTTLVDDLATLLAYCQLAQVRPEPGLLFPAEHQKQIKPFLLGSNSTARLALMLALALDLGIATDTGGMVSISASARKWLDAPRPAQVRGLADAWLASARYNELWHVPTLTPERTGWQNDPLLARQTVMTYLEMVPPEGWWPVETFVSAVKEDEPDFQRPNGDYESWYIRDAQSGAYLRSFESWDKVDGALLRFLLSAVMHGLGLVDIAQNGAMCRLTAYGRALAGFTDWPVVSTETENFTIKPDGLIEVPRTTSRYDRFQLARFTEWIRAADPFQYRISAAGLDQAAGQNIRGEQILTFLRRGSGDAVPGSVVKLIEMWDQGGAGAAQISRMVVLRLPNTEILESIQTTPALRRYLGATLGPTAVAVRADQWEALVAALQANGVAVEVDMAEES